MLWKHIFLEKFNGGCHPRINNGLTIICTNDLNVNIESMNIFFAYNNQFLPFLEIVRNA